MNTKALAINIKKEVKTLKMILYSMIIGIVIFSLVSLTVKRFINPLVIDNQRQGNLFLIVFFTVVIALSVLRYYFSRSIKKLTASSQSESEKFIAYRSASIIFFSVSELIALVGVIAFLLLSYPVFLCIPVVILLEMLVRIPTTSKMNAYISNTSHL